MVWRREQEASLLNHSEDMEMLVSIKLSKHSKEVLVFISIKGDFVDLLVDGA